LVRAALFLPGTTREWKLVDFLVDTGCGSSVIHPKDAVFALGVDPLKLLDPAQWPQQRTVYGVGGASINYVVDAHWGFLQDDGNWDVFQAATALAEFRLDNQRLPSLLGWDILQRYQSSFSWQNKEIKLAPLTS